MGGSAESNEPMRSRPPLVPEEQQLPAKSQDGVAQASALVQVTGAGEGTLPDQAVSTPLVSETTSEAESASVEAAPNVSAATTDGLHAATDTGLPRNGDEGDKELTEVSADSIAAAAAAMADKGQKPQSPSTAANGAAVPKQALSDMPPPSLLPRQLRLKRISCGEEKTASVLSSRTRAPTTSSRADTCSANDTTNPVGELKAKAEGGQPEGEAGSPAIILEVPSDARNVDEEFVLFMKEIQQLDVQREAEADANSGDTRSALSAALPQQDQQVGEQSSPSSEGPHDNQDIGASQLQQLQEDQAPVWQAVVDAASGKEYYWNVTTDEVTWEVPNGYLGVKAPLEDPRKPQQPDLQQWAASTFKLTQELPTSTEKVQQLMLQLDFIEDELDAMHERAPSTQPVPVTADADNAVRLERFRSLKRQREQQRQKRSQEATASGSDDELLKELIDLQLQQDQRPAPGQCGRCRQRIWELRGTQSEQTKIRSLASSLARRLGNVEKEWAAAMLAALKARLDDWVDGGLSSSFFFQRLDGMQQDLEKHLAQDAAAEVRQQDLASAFPYSAAAAMTSASAANKAGPRNCLAIGAAPAASDKASNVRLSKTFRSVAAAPKSSTKASVDQPAALTAPPTPAGPPPMLPDELPPDAAQAEAAAAAAAADFPRHRDVEAIPAASRDGAQAPVAVGGTAKRTSSGIGSKRLTSSNPLVRKRMQLVEKWQKSREKGEESEEEDYEQRKERLKQRKLDEWKEREMASHRGMKNANFIEVTADWRELVGKK